MATSWPAGPAEIPLCAIVSAVDGPIAVGDFGQPHQDGACNHEGQCVLLAVWQVVSEHMRTHLHGFTLAHLAAAAHGEAPWPAISAPHPHEEDIHA